MAFEIENFKQIGGPGNSQFGGQSYSVFSTTDGLVTMLSDGYLDDISDKLNVGDNVTFCATDGNRMVKVENTDTVTISANVGSVDFHENAGAINPFTAYTELIENNGLNNVVTLADGKINQRKTVALAVQASGSAQLQPINSVGFTNISITIKGSTVSLVFSSLGWIVVSHDAGVFIT